jgi:hypothetical protein
MLLPVPFGGLSGGGEGGGSGAGSLVTIAGPYPAAMLRVDTPPDDFLAALADGVRPDMQRLDALITAAMPGRSRVLWEGAFWGGTEQHIIGYGDLVQPRPRGEDVRWFVVGLARQKAFISVYVNAADGRQYLLAQYANRLGKVKTGSAVLNIRSLDDLEQDTFSEMMERANALCPPNPG